MSKKKLLVVDDEKDYREALARLFEDEFEVHTARDGIDGVEKARSLLPDLVILDIMMPGMGGNQVCHRLRNEEATRNLPIIFLTSRTDPRDESFGLELGADDYVTKPFDKEVLRARVHKRLGGGGHAVGEVTELGDCKIYWERHEAVSGEQRVPLTTKEIGLLRLFVENRGRLLTRNMILEKVWADTYITDRTIDSHIKELRKKLPPMARLLKTVYGSGYRLDL